MELKILKNKAILFQSSLYVIDDVREEDDLLLMSKLESNAEIEEFDLDIFRLLDFDFENARLEAVDVMNQTRYYDNILCKEKDSVVD